MIDFKTEKFQGPLALLLQLIEKEEMDITEVALAAIADQYVSYVEESEEIDPEEVADFLVIAARLLYIKSKALLPYLSLDEEEDDASELERQLKMYKEFVDASLKIKEMIATAQPLFAPEFSKKFKRHQIPQESFSPPQGLGAQDLRSTWLNIVSRLKKESERKLPEEKLEAKVSLDERISHIRNLLKEKLQMSFHHLLHKAQSKVEVIVDILALLELAKQREIIFEQEELFSEIKVSQFKSEL